MKISIITCIIFIIIADIIYIYLKKKNKLKNNLIYIIALCCGPILNIIYSTAQDANILQCIKNAFLFIIFIILTNFYIKFFKKNINNQKNSFKNIKQEFKDIKINTKKDGKK